MNINRWIFFVVILAGLLLSACGPASIEEEASRPVRLEPIEGTDLNRVILTEQAAERLDIQTAQVRDEQVLRTQLARGEVIASPKLKTTIKAPTSGTVLAPTDVSIPVSGAPVSAGQVVFRLAPITALSADSSDKSTVNLKVPADSVMLRFFVTPGQFVEVGQPLFDIADTSKVWIRVPLNESEFARVDRSQGANVLLLEGDDTDAGPVADAIDDIGDVENDADEPGDTDFALYYGIDNADHGLTLGQHVKVKLALSGSESPRTVVLYSSIIYGQQGETWVFVNPEPLTYMRYPVSIDYIQGDLAVLSEGPEIGTQVVTVGAAELYGSEFEFEEE